MINNITPKQEYIGNSITEVIVILMLMAFVLASCDKPTLYCTDCIEYTYLIGKPPLKKVVCEPKEPYRNADGYHVVTKCN